ncbi:MAG TPA: TIGR03364 family FAD-dependent oxidoreductase [Bryobacteraceae bacterium]|nr:TIGR03364 family FAD-dependent oxidoreductase [Bryobacteraceae bacterium]
MENKADVAIIGAGILGLAHAYAAAKRGHEVVLFERGLRATGASVRNFGMIWPIGQPYGQMHAMALRSREIWREVLDQAGLPSFPTGSLHVVYREDEAAVAREFADLAPALGYRCAWLDKTEVLDRSQAVRPEGLLGGLWSDVEITVDPRLSIASLPAFLSQRFDIEARFGTVVRSIDLPTIDAGTERWKVTCAIVCGGDDFETLYPDQFSTAGLTRVKLQMLRTLPQPAGWQLGPALAAGLTLRFYPAFNICTTLPALRKRIADETPEYDRWQIHGLVSQTAQGELTLGDSHEYGACVDVFNKEEVDRLILHYIRGFLRAPDISIAARWHGVYARHPEKPYVSLSPADGVRIVTATGGSGMTLSFGLAERTITEMNL